MSSTRTVFAPLLQNRSRHLPGHRRGDMYHQPSNYVTSLYRLSWKVLQAQETSTRKRVRPAQSSYQTIISKRGLISSSQTTCSFQLISCLQQCLSTISKPALYVLPPTTEAHSKNTQVASRIQHTDGGPVAANMPVQSEKYKRRYPAPAFLSSRACTQGPSHISPTSAPVWGARFFKLSVYPLKSRYSEGTTCCIGHPDNPPRVVCSNVPVRSVVCMTIQLSWWHSRWPKVNGHHYHGRVRSTLHGRCFMIALNCASTVQWEIIYLKRKLRLYALILLALRPSSTGIFSVTVSTIFSKQVSCTRNQIAEQSKTRANVLLVS